MEAGLSEARAAIKEAKSGQEAPNEYFVPKGPMYRNATAFHRYNEEKFSQSHCLLIFASLKLKGIRDPIYCMQLNGSILKNRKINFVLLLSHISTSPELQELFGNGEKI